MRDDLRTTNPCRPGADAVPQIVSASFCVRNHDASRHVHSSVAPRDSLPDQLDAVQKRRALREGNDDRPMFGCRIATVHPFTTWGECKAQNPHIEGEAQ